MPTTLRTRPHTTADGDKSKAIVIANEAGVEIVITLGVEEARALSAALKPSGKDIALTGTQPWLNLPGA